MKLKIIINYITFYSNLILAAIVNNKYCYYILIFLSLISLYRYYKLVRKFNKNQHNGTKS